jgi:ubiquitin-conjugating enzyme E2 variant
MMDSERPIWATILQKCYITQSYNEHHYHHTAPHDCNYCPITPYVNIILENYNFWRKLEKTVFNITGVLPRTKELKWINDPNYPAEIKFIN